jgi:hypothetical protein
MPRAQYHTPARSVLVLTPGAIPTTDLYLLRRLENLNGMDVRYVNTFRDIPNQSLLSDGAFVFIVRYGPPAWLRLLDRAKDHLAGVVFLIDYDIPDVLRASELPRFYALKTAWRYLATRRLLSKVCDEVWVSTPYLKQKYAGVPTRVLPPLYLGTPSRVKSQSVTYFYHGTGAHRREIEFLVEVVRRVQSRLDHVHFEIMGGRRTQRLYKGIPRVRVLQSMAWPDFLSYTSSVSHAVGLAPMLDTHFNRARSHNKLHDITRCGAAGIYSDNDVFRGHIRDGYNGLLCPNDPAAWVERICQLLTDEPKRAELYSNALANCEAHASDPEFRLR